MPRSEPALMLALGVLWAAPFALTKTTLATIPPVTAVAARVAVAAAVLWLVVLATGRMRGVRGLPLGALLVQAVLGCLVPYTTTAIGQLTVDSALASILNSSSPVFLCVICLIGGFERVAPTRIVGVILGLGGIVMLAGWTAAQGLGQQTMGQIVISLGTLSIACGALYARRFAQIPSEVAAAVTLTWTAVLLWPAAFVFESPLAVAPSTASLAALLANAVIATALGFVIYFRLVRTVGALTTSGVGYLKMGFGVLIGCIIMGEPVTPSLVLGFITIMAGVACMSGVDAVAFWRLGRRAPA